MHNARIGAIVLTLICLLVAVGVVQADGPTIGWSVFSGGGAPASAANITLNGSMGQTAVGRLASNGYVGTAGYWLEAQVKIYYFPIMFKQSNWSFER